VGRTVALLVALSAGVACSDDPIGAPPQRTGTLTLLLTTPHTDDGAVMFEVSGPPVDSVLAANTSLRLFTRRADGSTVVGVAVGVVTGDALVMLHVPDTTRAAEYTARLLDVADRGNVLRASLAGYALSVMP
jgi:hypothetical protein